MKTKESIKQRRRSIKKLKNPRKSITKGKSSIITSPKSNTITNPKSYTINKPLEDKSQYFVYSYSSIQMNGEKKEQAKAYVKNSKGTEKFHVVEKKNEKIIKDMEGEKSKSSSRFLVKSNGKSIEKTKEEVYKILLDKMGNSYKNSIEDFLQSKEYKKLSDKTEKSDKK